MGLGYIAAVADQQQGADMAEPPPPRWANGVFKMSLWSDAHGKAAVMIKPDPPGNPLKPCWLSEFLAMPVANCIAWDVHLRPSPPGADPTHVCTMQRKFYKFQDRRAGQFRFCALGEMAAKMGLAMESWRIAGTARGRTGGCSLSAAKASPMSAWAAHAPVQQ
jgi:hypothetical protein